MNQILKKYLCVLFFWGLGLLGVVAQSVTNGSVTGAPRGNSLIANATGWTGCGFSPDLCDVTFPSYVAVNAGVSPAPSPDGGTWLGLASLNECARTTITGLTPGTVYTLYFCGACFGTGTTIFNGGPARPIITVVGATGGTQQFMIPRVGLVWTGFQMTFTATAATHTLQVSHPNTVSPQAYASLDGFSLSTPCTILLPVELFEFTAKRINNRDVLLNWKTASEQNADFFAVERSTDGIEFFEIGRVSAAGNSTDILPYEFIDKNLPDGAVVYYYRIRTVDVNLAATISDLRAVSLPDVNGAFINVYPNPATEILYIDLAIDQSEDIDASFEVYNALGQKVYFGKPSFHKGQNLIELDIKNFVPGHYVFELRTKEFTHRTKFVKR